MTALHTSIPAALRERARRQPDAAAYTFVDYQVDPAGYVEALTWAQAHQRAQVVAAELASCGSPGDRVAICAPQGLEYIVGVLGATLAGFAAVPLTVPALGAQDARVGGVLADSSPAAVLTTSAVVDDVVACTRVLPGSDPAVIEVDALDFVAPPTLSPVDTPQHATALLQYTSGSTHTPAGVAVTHQNVIANLDQAIADNCDDRGGILPSDATMVSWLPFYHDMGLMFGIFLPVRFGVRSVVTDPVAFLQKPARWMQMLATNTTAFSGAPNFAFALAARRTSDEDMAGLDLGGVLAILNGAERVQAPTIDRFLQRFARYNFPAAAIRPAYGLAEATVYVTSSNPGRRAPTARFDYAKLSGGQARRCGDDHPGSELVSHGTPRACTVRIVDPDSCMQKPAGGVGEIWIHGDNVAGGYWRNPDKSKRTFTGQLVDPAPGTPRGPWLRTGDLGVITDDGEFYVVGRIKDLLVVDGQNHYPDDIEITTQKITGGRVAAVAAPGEASEQLVVVAEIKTKSGSEIDHRLRTVKKEVTAAIAQNHAVRVADFVAVAPGSIPITTSGKIRRAACAEQYRQDGFLRLEAADPRIGSR
jgi:long chain fatty acid CoA FadD26